MKKLTLSLFSALLAFTCLPATAAETGEYKIDTVHSAVTFQIMHNGVNYVPGRFNKFDGKIVLNMEDPAKNELDINIDTASIYTGNMKRDEHLKGPDFFNTKQFPKATFVSKNIKLNEDESYSVTGDLTMLGKTNTVTLKIKMTGKNDGGDDLIVGGWGEFTLKRSLFGMDYGVGKIGDDVIVTMHIQAVKKK